MSDRLAVMNRGTVEQVGRPKDVYEEPRTAYVADFLGVSNLMPATVSGPSGDGARVKLGDFELESVAGDTSVRGQATVTIRPERVLLERQDTGGTNRIPGVVERTVYLGATLQVHVKLASQARITVLATHQGDEAPPELSPGTAVTCYLPAGALRILRPSSAAETTDAQSANA